MITLMQGLAILDLASRVLRGDSVSPADVARTLVGIALDLVPVDELAPYLTEEARRRDDAAVDLVEAAKFGVVQT